MSSDKDIISDIRLQELLDADQIRKVAKWKMQGFNPEEIAFMIKEEENIPVREGTVEKYLETDEAKRKVRLMAQIQEKKAEVTKEDLVRDLKNLKELMEAKVEELKDSEHGVTMNESAKNIIRAIDKIGQLIGEIGVNKTPENLIRVDKLQVYIKNNTDVLIQQLEKEEQEKIVKDLTDELGLKIIKKDDDDEKSEKKATKKSNSKD